MRYYSYFPGCSSSHGGCQAYDLSAQAVARGLDMELIELEDWNCCGSTPYTSVDELASLCISARNLALAEKRGIDLVTPCSSCYVILNRTNSSLKRDKHLGAIVDDALSAGSLVYHRTVRVRHLLDVVVNDVGYENITPRVKRKLEGLRVAPYYGCQVVRPGPGFDHPESPQSLERLIGSLGAVATPFPLKARCCGGSLIVSEENIALRLIAKLLHNATANGAECMVTVCPLCQTNLDVYQALVNKKLNTDFNIPVLFFTQLIGLALGFEAEALGLERCIVPADGVLARCAQT